MSQWIGELIEIGLEPQIFVIARIPGDADWRVAEVEAIRQWYGWSDSDLPYVHPPQTPKSVPTEIRRVSLLNVQGIGSVTAPGECE